MSDTVQPSDPGDAELADRVERLGDEAAFRALYRRHTPSLLPFLTRLVGDAPVDAEDLIQETWITAVTRLPGFRWDSSFRTWLLGIGLNHARRALRRTGRGSAVVPEAPTAAPPRAATAPERVDLERAIAELPEAYRTVLLLHDVEGLTHPEIGRLLDIATGTARSQLHHARRAVRRILEPDGGHDEPAL